LVSSVLSVARADVLVVNGAGGGDFTTLQAAVDAAADGDVLLVKGGTYAGVHVDDKSLSIVADTGQTVTLSQGIVIENLAFGRRVNLIRLQVTGDPSPGGGDDDLRIALVARNNLGAVRALACTLTGAAGDPADCYPDPSDCQVAPDGWDGVRLENNLQVSFAGCVLRGGSGLVGVEYYGHGGDGGGAVVSDGSQSAFYNCVLEGADGVYGGQRGGLGGEGLTLGSQSVFASATSFRGGDGGPADDFIISYGGDGGDAVHVAAGAEVRLVEPTFIAGGPGDGLFYDGEPGVDVSGAGQQIDYGVSGRALQVPIPVDDGSVLTLGFFGEPGDLAFLLLSGSPGFIPAPAFFGVVLTGNGPLKFQGIVGAGGVKTKNIPLNVLGPGDASLEGYLQGVFVDASQNVIAGSPNHLLVVDPSL
jgi:hypothetical protein